MLNSLFSAFVSLPYLTKTKLPFSTKVRIIGVYLTMLLFAPIAHFIGKTDARILGMRVGGFSYPTLAYLFGEVFFKQEYYTKLGKSDPVIIDCGANLGMATLYFKWLYPNSTVHAFEPDPATFALLATNVHKNALPSVSLYNVALGATTGEIEFHVNAKNSGSLLMSTQARRGAHDVVSVPAIKLSEVIREKNIAAIDLLKIDIEGAETEVLQDLTASGTIKLVRTMIIEYHHKIDNAPSAFGSFLSMLENAGFEYQVNARNTPVSRANAFQDVLLYCYRV